MAETEPTTEPADKKTDDVRKRKSVVGEVVSTKMEKTISVRVMRTEKHRTYYKYIQRKTIFKAHDEQEQAEIGDTVRIGETRPLSKTKRWRLIEIVRKSTQAV
ncbi:MAG: 30S ribosomal protein S17 [Planctomycetota bacterium]|jgi:small subunit ribosomal protein S17